MTATSPAALARKRERRIALRRQRNQNRALSLSSASLRGGFALWRRLDENGDVGRDPLNASAFREADRVARLARPFVAVDGEGITVGGRHRYALFRMGERELYRRGRRLTTPEILEFILADPHDNRSVQFSAFAFEYDISCILQDVVDLPPDRLKRLLRFDLEQSPTLLAFDGYPLYGVKYLPHNYLKVCYAIREDRVDKVTGRAYSTWVARNGRWITIEDAWRCFQSSFVNALADWGIGGRRLGKIIAMKAQRADFSRITPAIRRYCAAECELHAELMEEFRRVCIDVDVIPREWSGAGKLAATMLASHGAWRRRELEAMLPAGLIKMAHAAFYGGRMEVTRCGIVGGKMAGGPVYAHDIRSAYPSEMATAMPCLSHGHWRLVDGDELDRAPADSIYVAPVHFCHPADAFLCGLPIRSRKARLLWPREGNGVYWSCEIAAARKLGAVIEHRKGWLYERCCDCQPMGWVAEIFEQRRRLGGKRGKILKLGANALYGKQVQRVGSAAYQNLVYGGLITARTRSKVSLAIAAFPKRDRRRVVMIATDALFTLGKPAKVDVGDQLGRWEVKRYPRLFIVQPGLYWPLPDGRGHPRSPAWRIKSRGLSPKFFESRTRAFERAWAQWCDSPSCPLPRVAVAVHLFVGLRLAAARGKLDTVGQWQDTTRTICFDWLDKRGGATWTKDKRGLILGSVAGSPSLYTHIYTTAEAPLGDLTEDGEVQAMTILSKLELSTLLDDLDLTQPFIRD